MWLRIQSGRRTHAVSSQNPVIVFRAANPVAKLRLAYDVPASAARMAILTGKSATRSAIWPKAEMPSQLRLKQNTRGTRDRPPRIAHDANGAMGKIESNKSRTGLASRF